MENITMLIILLILACFAIKFIISLDSEVEEYQEDQELIEEVKVLKEALKVSDLKQRMQAIYNHFEEVNQLNKLIEEANELKEAVEEKDVEHIVEEVSDVLLVCMQIVTVHNLNKEDIEKSFYYKLGRTEKRIKEGYYKQEV